MKINQNLLTLKPSATLQINEKVRFLREKGKKVYHFGFGQSPFPIHPEIVTSLKEQAENNHYLPVNGLDILRAKIASFLEKKPRYINLWKFNFYGSREQRVAVSVNSDF